MLGTKIRAFVPSCLHVFVCSGVRVLVCLCVRTFASSRVRDLNLGKRKRMLVGLGRTNHLKKDEGKDIVDI